MNSQPSLNHCTCGHHFHPKTCTVPGCKCKTYVDRLNQPPKPIRPRKPRSSNPNPRPKLPTPYVPPPPTGPLTITQARLQLPPVHFRMRLRAHMLKNPTLTLEQVARQLGITRQRVSSIVGPLARPTCTASTPRPAPKTEEVRAHLAELEMRVFAGEPLETAAAALGLSVNQAYVLGFRVSSIRPAHGTRARFDAGCQCWRCRRAGGVAVSRKKRKVQ